MKKEEKVVEMPKMVQEVVDPDGNEIVEKKKFHLPNWLNKKTIIAGTTALVVTGLTLVLLALKSDGDESEEDVYSDGSDSGDVDSITFHDGTTGEETVVEV